MFISFFWYRTLDKGSDCMHGKASVIKRAGEPEREAVKVELVYDAHHPCCFATSFVSWLGETLDTPVYSLPKGTNVGSQRHGGRGILCDSVLWPTKR